MKSILFFDPVAPRGYTYNTLRSEALGGSEASLLRVAKLLAVDNDVCVYQNADPFRGEVRIDGVRHIGQEGLTQIPDIVVHFRTSELMQDMREEMPNTRHIMWAQDFFARINDVICLEGEEVIVLSEAHKLNLLQACDKFKVATKAIHVLPNPVEVDAIRQPKVERRLGFFSSPHKGLNQVIEHFTALSRAYEGLSMVYANPGYIPSLDAAGASITNLGMLRHAKVMEELSKCSILFYPQTVFPETFGIVLAEANAMGVPVLAHDFGAASEVLRQPGNIVTDCNNFATIEQGLVTLLQDKPIVNLDLRFEMKTVADMWRKLLEA
jgi:glycosyltransferase involved in cell wall biosynthesis